MNAVPVPVTVPSVPANATVEVPVTAASVMSAPHMDTFIELPSSPAYLAANSP